MLAILFKVKGFLFKKFINLKFSLDWIKNEAMFDVKQAGYQTLTIPQDGNYRSGLTVSPAGTFPGNNPGTGMRTFWQKMFLSVNGNSRVLNKSISEKFFYVGHTVKIKQIGPRRRLIKRQYTYKTP